MDLFGVWLCRFRNRTMGGGWRCWRLVMRIRAATTRQWQELLYPAWCITFKTFPVATCNLFYSEMVSLYHCYWCDYLRNWKRLKTERFGIWLQMLDVWKGKLAGTWQMEWPRAYETLLSTTHPQLHNIWQHTSGWPVDAYKSFNIFNVISKIKKFKHSQLTNNYVSRLSDRLIDYLINRF